MSVIVFVSPKGGAGKTTAALLLALELARSKQVIVIDADPNHPIKVWYGSSAVPKNLTVVSDVTEDNILGCIRDAAGRTPFVVVDLEGTAAKIVLFAVSQADLVIIPTQGSQLDAEQTSRAIRVLKQSESLTNRAVLYAVLLMRTNPIIRTRTMAHIQRGLIDAGIPVFTTELHEREAFRAVFSFRVPLEVLNPVEVANLDKAIANASAFAMEVIERLRQGRARVSV